MKLIGLSLQGKNRHLNIVTLVDDEDYDFLIKYRWRTYKSNGNTYAVRSRLNEDGTKTIIRMHREIMNPESSSVLIDHKDGDGLNNQKYNLRKCSNAQNLLNKKRYKNSASKYKGVFFCKKTNKWTAAIVANKKSYYLGHFESEVDAAIAYNNAANRIHGDFARLNII